MSQYAIITENDISKWEDKTGVSYHFPNRYLKFLQPGTKIIYYKGKLRKIEFRKNRLSDQPHYFGKAEIGAISKDGTSNSYAKIHNYTSFLEAIPFKVDGIPYEEIPESRKANYWRDGVRPMSEEVYFKILGIDDNERLNDNESGDQALTSSQYEGGSKKVYSTVFERNEKLRFDAIKIHGYSCMACDFNFHHHYGSWGDGYIHVHHIKPISTRDRNRPELVNPKTDLVVVCANCHSMIHRRKDKLLSIEELRDLIAMAK